MTLLACYYMILLIVDLSEDLRQFNYLEQCLGRREVKEKSRAFGVLTVGMPQFVVLVATVSLDIFNHISVIQTENQMMTANTDEERQKREKIPKRATFISSCMFVPFTATSLIFVFGFDLSLEVKTATVAMGNALVAAMRNPVIARFAFQVNQQIQKESVDKRRQQEIQEALERRQEQRRAREEVPLEVLDV